MVLADVCSLQFYVKAKALASIKQHKDELNEMMHMEFGLTPDGIHGDGVPLAMVVRQAFGVSDDDLLNELDWVRSTQHYVEANGSLEDAPKLEQLTQQQRGVMLLPVLGKPRPGS